MPRPRLPQSTVLSPARLRVIAMTVITTLALGSLAVFAYLSRGYPANRVELNDAGVWVTNDSDGLFGRLNKSAASLDAYFNPQGGAQTTYTLDILQDAGAVLAWDRAAGTLSPVDVASAKIVKDNAVPVPSTRLVDMRGGTVAVLDPATGKLWATRYATDAGSQLALSGVVDTAKPLAELEPAPKELKEGARFSALAVDGSGGVHAVDATGTTITVPVTDGVLGKAQKSSGPARESVDLAAVGDHVVVLDVVGGTLSVDGAAPTKRDEIASGSRLQASGPAADDVLLASPKALYGFSVSTPQASARLLSDVGAGAPAAPIRVQGCAYAAWSGSPGTVVKGCGSQKAAQLQVRNAGAVLSRPVFRVNRSQVVVNDAADGQVYDLDSLERVDNWTKAQDAATDQTVVDTQVVPQDEEKPKANRDDLGARPGRTTILHVLDNDTDKGGRVLSVSAVTQPGNPNASVAIAPDGQTLIYTLNDQGGSSDFSYTLSNGVTEAKGDVSVADKGLVQNNPPKLKSGGTYPAVTVPSGGTVPVQVLDLWRDEEGDPVGLASAEASAGTTNITADGRIELTAAATQTTTQVKLSFGVTDGRSEPVRDGAEVTVLGSTEIKSTPVAPQPDVARGEVGRPILVTPLLNDLPGADPLNPRAVMKLAAPVTPRESLDVQTDLVSGQVSVTGSAPGHFFLEYTVAFGSAAVATGQLRVDIEPAREDNRSPVAVPDQAVVRGTGSVLVDVLANDSDPLGSVLTVQSATAANPGELKVAVVNGRWLKVTPSTAALNENPTIVKYRLSNGVSPAVEGVVSVTQLPTASPDQILTRSDYATVRTGDATTIRVLENDAALSGATLSLLGNVPDTKAPGQLKVYNPGAKDATGGDLGAAYVSGDVVRYVAPQAVTEPTKVVIEYVAQTEAGDRATGTVEVTVLPQPTPTLTNQSPTPHPVEARAVSGETLVIPIDPNNADPDGDSTSVMGITSAPTLGRVLGFSPTGITYQAYPDESAQGTDSFTYAVTDRFGATATSTIRVGVTPPSVPSAPVPAPLSITASPGSKVTLYPLLSGSFGRTDSVSVLPLEQFSASLPEGASLDVETQSIRGVVGAVKDRPVQFSYGLTGNGGPSAPATVTLVAVDGYKNPPRLQDVSVKPDGSGKGTVDVLANAFDPDGDSGKLKVTKVGLPEATVDGGKITVPVTANVRAIPYEVTDESGATSAAMIYVPSEGSGGPYARAGKVIAVPEGQSVTVNVADYVEDPKGKPVMLTLTDLIKAGPTAKVTASAPTGSQLTVTGAAGYIGPGAVVAEFTNGKSLDDPEGIKTFVSIPVQVGPETPVLRCPSDVIPVIRGGKEATRDITSFCSVWAPTAEMGKSLEFEGTWATPLDGVSLKGGRTLTIDASSDAKPGATAVINVTATGTKATPSPLNVIVQEAPKATLSPITLPEMKAGESRQVNLEQYFSSPLKDPKPKAISIEKTVGMDAQSSVQGMTATITPGAAAHGRMEFKVVVTDVNEKDATDQARRVTGTIGFDVFTKPDAPGQPQPQAALMSRSATLSWTAPASNGAPILDYEVAWSGGTRICPSSPCTVTGLTNGDDYTFTVRARNKADWSAPSARSGLVRPNAMPLAVVATQTAANDRQVTLTWPSAQGEGSAITDYVIAWNGQTQSVGPALTATLPVPANGPAYTFTLVAQNNSVNGPSSTATGSAAGTPSIGSLTAAQAAPADSATTTVTVTIAGTDPNGPQPASYTVTRNGAALPACTGISSTVCIDQGVTNGETVTYAATASTTFLGQTRTSPAVASAAYTPFGTPGAWGAVTARAANLSNQVTLSYTVPPSRGKTSVVTANVGQGWVAAPAVGPAGGAGSITLGGSQGGGQAQLRVCNEGNQCSTSAPVPYNAYADTTTPGFISGSVNNTVVCVGAQANANGWSATLTLNGASTSGSGALQIGQVCQDVGWNTTATFTATITDSAHPNGEPGRSTKTATWSATTGPKPRNPHFVISHSNGLPYVTLYEFVPGSTVSCFAEGAGGLKSWSSSKVVDANGFHPAFRDGSPSALVDSAGYLFTDGSYAPGDSSSGLTCN